MAKPARSRAEDQSFPGTWAPSLLHAQPSVSDSGSILVRLEFASKFDMLDVVQLVSDHVGRLVGLDENARHWLGVAVRESVINAIKHGNREDETKQVFVEFASAPASDPTELIVRVRDQGEGFEPGALPDCLAPENLLKASGRGIFFIRSLVDDVTWRRLPEGGMEVKMVKKLPAKQAGTSPHEPG